VICDHDHFYVKYGDQNDRVDHTHTQGYIVFFFDSMELNQSSVGGSQLVLI
jgi:hypothetical protein